MVQEDEENLPLYDDHGVEQVYAPEILRDTAPPAELPEISHGH